MTKKKTSQNVIIIMCWLLYSLAYLGRFSYNANITLIMEDYGVNRAQAGLVATFFFFAYGIGQVINGILSSKYNKKWIFPIALTLSSAINIAVFFGTPFFTIKYLWFINGLLQSCLWSGVISVISKTVDNKHMKWALVLMSTTTCVGTIATYSASSLFVSLNHYRLSFLFGAAVMTALGIIWFNIYGTELEVYQPEAKPQSSQTVQKGRAGGVMTLMILLGFFAVLHNIVKDGLTTWMPDILKQRYALKDSISILSTIILPILGIVGAIMVIKINQYIKNFVLLISLLFAVGAIGTGCIAYFVKMPVILAVFCFGAVVCMMHGINNITNSLAPLKMRDRIDSGKMAGIINGCCYAGSTISSYGMGKIADLGGWQLVLNILFILCIFAVVVGLLSSPLTKEE